MTYEDGPLTPEGSGMSFKEWNNVIRRTCCGMEEAVISGMEWDQDEPMSMEAFRYLQSRVRKLHEIIGKYDRAANYRERLLRDD